MKPNKTQQAYWEKILKNEGLGLIDDNLNQPSKLIFNTDLIYNLDENASIDNDVYLSPLSLLRDFVLSPKFNKLDLSRWNVKNNKGRPHHIITIESLKVFGILLSEGFSRFDFLDDNVKKYIDFKNSKAPFVYYREILITLFKESSVDGSLKKIDFEGSLRKKGTKFKNLFYNCKSCGTNYIPLLEVGATHECCGSCSFEKDE